MSQVGLERELLASRQSRRILFFVCLLMLGFTLLNFLLVRSALPPLYSIGPRGEKGDPAVVDYDKIFSVIEARIASIPLPKDGNQGPVGPQGLPGIGIVGPKGPQGDKGDSIVGPRGDVGEPGTPGREIELRHNDEFNRTEWRYVGNLNWMVLFRDCEITDKCKDD